MPSAAIASSRQARGRSTSQRSSPRTAINASAPTAANRLLAAATKSALARPVVSLATAGMNAPFTAHSAAARRPSRCSLSRFIAGSHHGSGRPRTRAAAI